MQWLAFAIWLAYGVFAWRKRSRMLEWAQTKSIGARLPLSIGLLFGGAMALLCGLYAIESSGGLSKPWAWPSVVVLGVIFVHCQVLAVVLAISNVLFGDTSKLKQPSNCEEEVDQS